MFLVLGIQLLTDGATGAPRRNRIVQDESLHLEQPIPDLDLQAATAIDDLWKTVRQSQPIQPAIGREDLFGESRSITRIMAERHFWANFEENLLRRNISIRRETDGNSNKLAHEHFGERPIAASWTRGTEYRNTSLNTPSNPGLVSNLELWVDVGRDVQRIIRAFKRLINENAGEAEYAALMIAHFFRDDDPLDERCRAVARKMQSPIAREQNRPGSVLSPPLSSHESSCEADDEGLGLQIQGKTFNLDDSGLLYAREAEDKVDPETIVVSAQESAEYWNIAPDLVYRLTLRGFNPSYRGSSLDGIAHSRIAGSHGKTRPSTPPSTGTGNPDAPTIGYLSIEFKRHHRQPARLAEARRKAEFQMTAAGVLWLSWAYRCRVRACKLLGMRIGRDNFRELFAHVRHYGMTVRGAEYEVWVFEPVWGGDGEKQGEAEPEGEQAERWGGCEVRVVGQGSLVTIEGIKGLEAWTNEIHWWGVTRFFSGFEEDCKVIARLGEGRPGEYSAARPVRVRHDSSDMTLGVGSGSESRSADKERDTDENQDEVMRGLRLLSLTD